MITADHPLATVIAVLLPLVAIMYVAYLCCGRRRRD